MARSKICSVPGCPEVVLNSNGKCADHRRKARKEADKRTGRIRGSRWTTIRRTVIREEPFCKDGSVCGGTAPSTEVDHIIPLFEGGHPTARENLRGICGPCHNKKTREEHARQTPSS